MKSTIVVILWMASAMVAYPQGVLGKIKNKAENAAEKALEKKGDKKVEEKTGVNMDDSPSEDGEGDGSTNSSPTNKGGGGLVVTPPDVKTNMNDAESAFGEGNYSDAKYGIQQAMLGVELEIGHQVLESFPKTVDGLPVEDGTDKVTSTGWGWAGLTIERKYLKDDKELSVSVVNNAAWMTAINMYLSNPGYATTDTDQNWKQTKIQGNRGIIEYSDSEGYKISVPIGQTSLIIWQGINFADEKEITAATDAFNLDDIKKQLGEQ